MIYHFKHQYIVMVYCGISHDMTVQYGKQRISVREVSHTAATVV